MKRILVCCMLLTTLTFFFTHTQAQSFFKSEGSKRPTIFHAAQFKSLKWRNIGPFRGGRSVAVAGVPGQPLTYYMGTVGGGLWKTEDAGLSWHNISDGFFRTASVGAIAIAPSDPNILYVGMGEHAVRGVMTSAGDGVYKSTDGGKTWKNVGLIKSQHISSIQIHPEDPELVYVAVQGALYGPSEDRGVYLSEDGGKNWMKVLHLGETTGASDLSMDPHNPRVLYAGMWDHQRTPWQIRSGGPRSGVFRSADGGKNWKKVCDGLPKTMGKVGVKVSPANPNILYANIEAEEGGVFRSENGGENWLQVSSDRRTVGRAWYYTEIFPDPQDESTVYVLNVDLLKSIDGGRSFNEIPTPHGDQHDLWLNPANPQNMILANDGGGCISFNGGNSWSSQRNQPTGQFYRVIADNQFPYHIYGGQQDNSTVAIPSRTNSDGIDWKDWYAVSGCESGFIALDPDDPSEIYGGCYQGYISLYDETTKESKDVMAYPAIGLATAPKEMKYRFNWNAPIVAQPQDPDIIYHAANKVLQTQDGGMSWREISPDLTRDQVSKQGLGGAPFTNEAAGAENYNTISYLACSPHQEGVLWVGSDDGLVHLSKNDGQSWANVTPEPLQEEESLITSIEVSPHDPAEAYVVATRYRFNDTRPMIFHTTNFGKSWDLIVKGIARRDFVRVVREDPVQAGILYAGTEHGMYISFNKGERWFPFQLNLPVTPIRDMVIKNNDLVVATGGRAFWILDDLSPIQQSMGQLSRGHAQLFKPRDTYRVDGGNIGGPSVGHNPRSGVIIDYHLPYQMKDQIVNLQILNEADQMIRQFSNQEDEDFKKYEGGPVPSPVLTSEAGTNRFYWDMRGYAIPGVEKVYMYGDYQGRRVAPGQYTLRLITPKDTLQTRFRLLADPRLEVDAKEYELQEKLTQQIESTIREIHQSVNRMRDLKTQVAFLTNQLKKAGCVETMIDKGKDIQQRIEEWEAELIQSKQKTSQDVINFPNKLNAELADLLSRVDTHDPRVTSGAQQRFKDLSKEWQRLYTAMWNILNKDIADFNQMYKQYDVPALVVPNP
jgi:photosystem II stability/assembly factor-like uncharacterized protein